MKKRVLALLMAVVLLCGMAAPVLAANNYTIAISDGVTGTAVVEKDQTVKMAVTVSGALFHGLEAEVHYDSSKFELMSATGAAISADVTGSNGIVELFYLQHTPLHSGAVVAELTFIARNAGTGDFTVSGVVGGYEDFHRDAMEAETVGDSVKVESAFYSVTKVPSTVYWGNASVTPGDTYIFGVNNGYDKTFAEPTVTMGGESVNAEWSNAVGGWVIENVTGALVIESPKHKITFQREDANITLPANTSAHYGQDCSFTVDNMCIAATVKIGDESQKLTASPDKKITIPGPGKEITGDVVVTLAYAHTPDEAMYEWSDDYKTCTATQKCTVCKQTIATETAKSTSKVNSDGTTTFTAEFENSAFETQTVKTDFGKEIKVTFRLIGDTVHDKVSEHDSYVTWIPTTTYTMELGDYVSDLFKLALEDHDISYRVQNGDGYVYSIQAPDVLGGYWLEEKDNGGTSGWMYMVNGKYPNIGLMDKLVLKDGDIVIVHYVDDVSEEGKGKWKEASDISPKKYVERAIGEILNVGKHGTAKPQVSIHDLGKDITFKFIPDKGYVVKDVIVDGKSVGAVTSYTYKNLSIHSRIEVVFAAAEVADIVTVGPHGTVYPELEADDLGKDITFTFVPDEGYMVGEVIVDGKSIGAVTSYTYKNLTVNSRISVTFIPALQTGFIDVPAGCWYEPAVNYVAANGLFAGVGANRFAPLESMSRAMLVKVLHNMEGNPYAVNTAAYTDVADGLWYSDAIDWADGTDIISGYGNGKFGPNDPLTREQIAVIMYRYAVYKGYDTSASNILTHYSDFTDIAPYALKALKWANAEGLITGRSSTALAPKETATRAEVAAILYRFMENVAKK